MFNPVSVETHKSISPALISVLHAMKRLCLLLFGLMWFACKNEKLSITPGITGIFPESGVKNTIVSISGFNFSEDSVSVTLNQINCPVLVKTTTLLQVKVPPKAGSGKFIIQSGNRTAETKPFTYQVSTAFVLLAGDKQPGFVSATGAAARFNTPGGIAFDGDGNLFVADQYNHAIRRITPAGSVSTVAGTGVAGLKEGNGNTAQFDTPKDIARDNAGNLYIADFGNRRIRRITPAGVVSTLAGSTQGTSDGTGVAAQFNTIWSLVLNNDGNLYVCDNMRVRKVTTSGVVAAYAGSTTFGNADGALTSARFRTLDNITADNNGNLFVADGQNGKLRKIAGNTVSTISGVFISNFGSKLALDRQNNLFVTDVGGISSYANSGTGAEIKFFPKFVDEIAIDANGTMYVVQENAVYKIVVE
jgi:hypothetical protein